VRVLGPQRAFPTTQGSSNLKNLGTKPGMISYTISIRHPSRTYRANDGRQFLVRAFMGGGPASPRLDGDATVATVRIARTC
jgi:hypothetical protein